VVGGNRSLFCRRSTGFTYWCSISRKISWYSRSQVSNFHDDILIHEMRFNYFSHSSCWLPLHKEYPEAFSPSCKDVPVLQCHGESDPLVRYDWGVETSNLLKSYLTNHTFKAYMNMGHSSCNEVSSWFLITYLNCPSLRTKKFLFSQELRDVQKFILEALPKKW